MEDNSACVGGCDIKQNLFTLNIKLMSGSILEIEHIGANEVSDGVFVARRTIEIAKKYNLPVCEIVPIHNVVKASMLLEED